MGNCLMSLIGPDLYYDLFPSEALSESERIIQEYKALHPGWQPQEERDEHYNYMFPFIPPPEGFEEHSLR